MACRVTLGSFLHYIKVQRLRDKLVNWFFGNSTCDKKTEMFIKLRYKHTTISLITAEL